MAIDDPDIRDVDSEQDEALAEIQNAFREPIRVLIAWQPGSSDEAIRTAAWLSRSLNVHVRAVSTVLRLWPASSLSKLAGSYESWLHAETAAYTKQVKKAFRSAGLDPSTWDDTLAVIMDGPSEATLLSGAAESYDADVLLVGSRAATPKGRFLAGTTTDALLHSSPRPLGLAPRSVKLSKRGITRINVAYLEDETENRYPLVYGAELASRLDVPLRLVAFSPTGLADESVNAHIDIDQELSAEWYEHAFSILDRARDAALNVAPDIAVSTEVGTGVGWAGAVDALKWKKGDLLCMGSTPNGSIERVFLGSTSAQFLQHIGVPVLIHPGGRR